MKRSVFSDSQILAIIKQAEKVRILTQIITKEREWHKNQAWEWQNLSPSLLL